MPWIVQASSIAEAPKGSVVSVGRNTSTGDISVYKEGHGLLATFAKDAEREMSPDGQRYRLGSPSDPQWIVMEGDRAVAPATVPALASAPPVVCPHCGKVLRPGQTLWCNHCWNNLPPAVNERARAQSKWVGGAALSGVRASGTAPGSPLPASITRVYAGSRESTTQAMVNDAYGLAAEGYVPISQFYQSGDWGCGAWILAATLGLFLVGLLIIAFMVLNRPDGTLTVVYELRAPVALAAPVVAAPTLTPAPTPPASTKVCPDCAETIQAAARICRYCRHEFWPAGTTAKSEDGGGTSDPLAVSYEFASLQAQIDRAVMGEWRNAREQGDEQKQQAACRNVVQAVDRIDSWLAVQDHRSVVVVVMGSTLDLYEDAVHAYRDAAQAWLDGDRADVSDKMHSAAEMWELAVDLMHARNENL